MWHAALAGHAFLKARGPAFPRQASCQWAPSLSFRHVEVADGWRAMVVRADDDPQAGPLRHWPCRGYPTWGSLPLGCVSSVLRYDGSAMIDAEHWGAVLVVDDDLDFREAVAEVLESLGHRVFTAVSGREALRQLQADGVPRPCLILLDWILPPPAGPEFPGATRDAARRARAVGDRRHGQSSGTSAGVRRPRAGSPR